MMKILMINKFLYPNGGSETYIFKLGDYLESKGHEVQYFGMEHEGRCVGNRINAYTSDMDFHSKSKLSLISNIVKTIYSKEARIQIRKVLDDFKPDICHINNFNYQLTPSIILEIVKWRKEKNRKCRIIYTAHDSQLVCPMHLMQNPITKEPCTKCLGGHYFNCIKGKCIHGSLAKSIVGTIEAVYWNYRKVYNYFDVVISPSNFLAQKLGTNPILKKKIIIMHNFIDKANEDVIREKKDYILFFGRYSDEKGILTLLKVIDQLPKEKFVFAGNGPLVDEVNDRLNIINKGFLSGSELQQTIASAKFTIIPSECFENCPFSVMESQIYGTPVLGSKRGGIPELIQIGKTGDLFNPGDTGSLKQKILEMNENVEVYSKNCNNIQFNSLNEYCNELIKVYRGDKHGDNTYAYI